jgi:hypothetical protein
MRRTNEKSNQQPAQSTPHAGISISMWRVAAVLLLSLAEGYAQERPASKSSANQPQARPERKIVISIPDRKLALIEDGQVVKVYSVAVGKAATPSPSGEFRIRERITNPTYYAPGKVIRPGKSNPLGTRWIGLGQRGYGIHGTNEPSSIGASASHGCIRMNKKDVEELFELVRAGDLVVLQTERTAEIAAIFGTAPAAPAIDQPAKTAPAVVATVM